MMQAKQVISNAAESLVISIGDVDKQQTGESFKIGGALGQFLGSIERKPVGSVVMTLDAPQGAGKTRMVFQLANELAKNHRVLFASLEEHPQSKLFSDKRDMYIESNAWHNIDTIGELASGINTIDQLAPNYDVIVIDSWGKLGGAALDEFRNKHNGKLMIVIYQRTVTGSMRGGAAAGFDGDMICKINKNDDYRLSYAFWDKNRYQEIPDIKYSIFEKRIVNL